MAAAFLSVFPTIWLLIGYVVATTDYFTHFTDYSQDLQTRSNSETSLVSSNLGSNQLDVFNDDTELLLPSGGNSPNRLKTPHLGVRRLSATNKTLGGSLFTLVQPSLEPGVFRSLNYPAFQSLRIERVRLLMWVSENSWISHATSFVFIVRKPRWPWSGSDFSSNCVDLLKADFSPSHEPSDSIHLWRFLWHQIV